MPTAQKSLPKKVQEAEEIRKYYSVRPSLFIRDALKSDIWDMQREITIATFTYPTVAVKTCNAAGKGLALDTPIRTPNGWTTMGELQVDDLIFNQYGKPIKIIATHPVKNIDCYKVTFDNRTDIVCDADHLWTTLSLAKRHTLKQRKTNKKQTLPDWREYWKDTETLPITDMADNQKARNVNNYVIPTTKPLELSPKQYELHPYVLGAWLGDGTSHITVITDPAYEIREFVEALGYKTKALKDPKNYTFWPKGDGPRLLRSLGVYRNKHIPGAYMAGSRDQRLDLLRGLMDSDGHALKERGGLEFCSINQRLAQDVCKLIASLGWKCSVKESDAKLYGRFISKRYRVSFTASESPFRLERKTKSWGFKPKQQLSKNTCHVIRKIEKIESVPTRCITVEGGIFLAGEQLIPTHNSYIAARIALAFLLLKPGSIVITTAPTWRQVKDVLWREIRTALGNSPYELITKPANQVGIELAADWFAVGLSTNGAEKFFGYHADDILVIVDEASGVEDEIFTGVDAVTPNKNAHVLMIGNPTNPEGRFYKAFSSDFVKTFTVTAFDTPNFTANGIKNIDDLLRIFTAPSGVEPLDHLTKVDKTLKNPKPGLQQPSTVFRRYHEWGPDHPNWESLIMAQFPSQSEFSLIPLNLVEKSQEVWKQIQVMDKLKTSIKPEDIELYKEYVKHQEWKIVREGTLNYGVDVARFGSDRTVLTGRRGGYVEKQTAWAKLDTKITTDMVIDEMNLEDWRAVVTIDDTGVGGGVTDQLVHRKADNPNYHYRTIPINFSEGTNFPDKFFNLRSEMWWYLREKFINHQIAIPDDEDLRDELVAIRFKYVGKENNIIRIESKDDMKKRLKGKSPDRADSLLLSMFDLPDDRWSMAESTDELAKAAEAEPIEVMENDLEADPAPSGFGFSRDASGDSGLRFDDRY